MSNILKVSQPVSGYENSAKTNPITSNDTNINNITDVKKVTRLDNKSSNIDYQENRFILNSSNFDGFLKILKRMPSTTEIIGDLFFIQMENLITSGINEKFAEEISKFLEMINLSDDELFSFLKSEAEASGKFKGEFFDFLRSVLLESKSNELDLKILDLIKKYNDFSSSTHILNQLYNDLKNISKNIPMRYSEELLELIEHLNINSKPGDTLNNSNILKNEIIPFLSKYIKSTNDFSKVRDLITSVSLNIARYENSSEEGLLAAFESLLGYNSIKKKYGDTGLNEFSNFLLNINSNKSNENTLNHKLINIIERGINGEAGYENIEIFKGILSSLLINESVYMPLVHIMLPMNINNNLMFSEIWIDPDNDSSSEEKFEKNRKTKILVKFDIKDVGFFDLIILHSNAKVDIQVFCPDKIIKLDKTLKTALSGIIEKNGFGVNNLSVDVSHKPISLSEVFHKIYERKNEVNVRI